MMRREWWLLLGCLFFVSNVDAREVTITLAADQSQLILSNPSTVTVNYNISCHKPDGSGTIINLTNQNLAPNAQVKHTSSIPDSALCSGGASPDSTATDMNGKPFYFCNGSNSYANAANACGTGNSFCFPDISSTQWPGCSSFWIKNDGAVQHQPSCGSYAAVTGGNQVIVGGGSGYARKSPSAGVCAYFFAAQEAPVATTAGAVCCSTPQSGSVCKVTINTVNTNAYLSSPSFMGGAAF